jgi:hypothetical protein
MDDYYRNTRSKSISPKVSLDKMEYDDQETLEKDHFGAPIDEMCKEISECTDDLLKYVNSLFFRYIKELIPREDEKVVYDV